MRIQHNILAMNAYRNYSNNTGALGKNLEKLSSGYKINRAGDDAAGLAISEKMRAQITGLSAAQKNVKDGISLVKTGEGAMQEIHDMLNRMDYLATQSANGTYDNEVDRLNLQKEVDALKTEINRIADSANFNGIKLLDGSLDRNVLATEDGVTTQSVDFAKGIDFENGTIGGGTNGTYSVNLSTAFGSGDKLTVSFTDSTGSAGTPKDYVFGTDFTGKTVEEQAESLKSAIEKDFGGDYTVSRDGSTVTLTSKEEGAAKATITDFAVANADSTEDSTWKQDPAGTDGDTGWKFEDLFDNNTGTSKNVAPGDTLTFKFTVGTGTDAQEYTAELKVTDAMITGDTGTTTKAITDALKDTSFNGSTLKVKDLFTVDDTESAKGNVKFTGKEGGGDIQAVNISSTRGMDENGAKVAGSATAAASVYTVKLDTSGDAKNFNIGDKLEFTGKLADGRDFTLELEAGKDFEIGVDATASYNALKGVLETGNLELKTTDAAGKDAGTVKASEVFGDGKEIKVAASASGLVMTSKVKGAAGGKGIGAVTGVDLTPAAEAAIEKEIQNGAPQSAAKSTVTFNDGVQYGATIDVDGQTYEIVKTGERTSNGKYVAVEVADPSDANAVASAFADAFNKKGGADAAVKATASGNKVTLATEVKGSAAVAPKIATAGDKVKQLEFTLDPNKVQEKSYVTINGQDYQFVSNKKNADDGKTAIVVDLKNATSASLGQALKEAADGKNNASVTVDADGLVKVRGTENEDGEIVTPTASFHDGKGGLTLQIGDTADSYNQMNVSIGDMHTTALGIDGINIGNQEDAQAAIDVIRNAINYVSGVRGDLGAVQNRLDHTANNLSVMAENIQDAESTIRDTDVAEEMMSYVKNNILVQSAQAMLAQANQVPQGVLQLLG